MWTTSCRLRPTGFGPSIPYGVRRMHWKWKSRGLVVLLVGAFPVVAMAAAPEANTEFVFDLWHSRQFDRKARVFREASARMDGQLRDSQDRIAVKERLIADLLEGRHSFIEVVRQFEILNSSLPVPFDMGPNESAEVSDEQRAA